MQLDGAPVAREFYTALLLIVAYSVSVVWFVLVRPRRRIILTSSYAPPLPVIPLAAKPGLERPAMMKPATNMTGLYSSPVAAASAVSSALSFSPAPMVHPAATAAPEKPDTIASDITPEILKNLTNHGFIISDAPDINGLKPDIWALNGESVLIGVVCGAHGRVIAKESGGDNWRSDIDGDFKSPAGALYAAVENLNQLFSETLDAGTKIKVIPVVVMAEGNIENYEKLAEIWAAYGVKVFNHGAPEFEAFANKIKIEPKNESFIEYMSTIVWYYSDEKDA